jgi:hypothetical protein
MAALTGRALGISVLTAVLAIATVPPTLGVEPTCRVRNVTHDTSGRSLMRLTTPVDCVGTPACSE